MVKRIPQRYTITSEARLANTLVHNIRRLYTMDPQREGLGVIDDAAVAIDGGRVSWVGPLLQLRTPNESSMARVSSDSLA